MITSFKALNGILNNFTRAAGAGERVLAMMDLIPDIPIDKGREADAANLSHWSVTFEEVHFVYQMRPKQQVLMGVSVAVKQGQVGALVGKSGSGTSKQQASSTQTHTPLPPTPRLQARAQ